MAASLPAAFGFLHRGACPEGHGHTRGVKPLEVGPIIFSMSLHRQGLINRSEISWQSCARL
jgi:hypothetical protein